jgi:tetratricopeptide (TPR) repeat protein
MLACHGGSPFSVPAALRSMSFPGAALVLVALAAPAQATPPLPALPLDTYPPAARQAIARGYREAAERPDDAEAVGALARLLHAWEQWEAAHAVYSRAQAIAPRAFDWPYLDAVVLQRLARHAEAAPRLLAALAIAPDYLPARIKLAEALSEAGELERARTLFERLLAEPAAEPAARFGIGRIDAAFGRHGAAVLDFEKAIALFPEWGAAHYALALSLRALGRAEEAQRALVGHARFGAAWPAVPDPVLETVTALRDDAGAQLRRGSKLAADGDLPGAIACYEEALRLDPSLGTAHADLVKLYGRTEQWEKAEEHHRAAIALGTDLAEAHYNHGVLLGLQQRWDDAAEAYRRAIDVNPLHADAINNLGGISEGRREFEQALELYRRALAARPTFRLARFNAGRMLVALGRPAEAIADFERLVPPRDAEAPRYLYGLAVAHVRLGQRELGRKWAAEARLLALEHGQHELVAAIEHDLAALK